MFRHPKYYKELRKRNTEAVAKSGKSHASLESDQVISGASATASVQRAPGPGLTTLKKLVDKLTSKQADKLTSYKLPGPKPISEGNKGLIHKRKGGRVGPKVTS